MKKVLVGVLTLVMAFGFVGCSSIPIENLAPTEEAVKKGETHLENLAPIVEVVKEKGETHYGGDINNPIISYYVYEIGGIYPSEKIVVYVKGGTDNIKTFSYTYHSDYYSDEAIYPTDIRYVVEFNLRTDGTTDYKIRYRSSAGDTEILDGEICDIKNIEYVDNCSDIEITSGGGKMEKPKVRKIILDSLYRDYNHLNTRLNELFNVSLADWGYTNFSAK